MVELTLLEVHFDDSNFTATTGHGPGEKQVRASDETGEEPSETPTDEQTDERDEESSSGGGSRFAALVGLAFLVAVAYAARKRMQGAEQKEVLLEEDEEFEYTPAET